MIMGRERQLKHVDEAIQGTGPGGRGRGRGLRQWLRDGKVVLPLCLLIALLAAPSVPYMLPSYVSHLSEEYQPLQALRFFHSGGRLFDKYAPLPNLILAPGYGLTLAYWHATGQFGRSSPTFPFGFSDPLEQFGFLHLEGRIVFLTLGLVAMYFLGRGLKLVGRNRSAEADPTRNGASDSAVFLGFFFCVATNYILILSLPLTNPNSPILTFTAAALVVYWRILYLGLTVRRAFWLSIWAVCAISSKELAGPMFVLPYLGLAWTFWRESRGDPAGRRNYWRALAVALGTGVGFYALVNVVYAPATWWARIRFWLGGPGADSAVWGGGGPGQMAKDVATALLNNLGPGGSVVALVAVAALVIWRPRRWVMLSLPLISALFLGLIPMGYAQDRFYTIVALALTPLVVAGIDAIRVKVLAGRPMLRRGVWVALVPLMAANLIFATFTWFYLDQKSDRLIERDVVTNLPRGSAVFILNDAANFRRHPGTDRLERMGYRVDPRPLQQIMAEPAAPAESGSKPRWIYADEGMLGFIADAARYPARAKMMKSQSGFDPLMWRGVEALGYRPAAVLEPALPRWFVFQWMPAVRWWKQMDKVRAYERLE